VGGASLIVVAAVAGGRLLERGASETVPPPAATSAATGVPTSNPAVAAFGEVTETAAGGDQAPGLLPVGSAIPDLRWMLGNKRESVAGLRGAPLLLVFFATWCPHCQAETPVLSRLAERYAPQGLRVVGVTASPVGQDQRAPASLDDLRSYAAKYDARFPLLLDRALVGAQRFGVRGFPTLYVVDRGGVIRLAQRGEVPEATLAAAVEAALSR
jgi:thiol-disulfide isomerase/thioredoxin